MHTSAYIDGKEIDSLAGRWLKEIRSQTAPRPGLELNTGRAALLVIDMLRYFADPSGRCHLPAGTAIIGRIQSLVAAWRALKRPVIFTRHCHEGEHDLGMLGRFFSDYIHAGEPDAEIVPALAPLQRECVFKKTTYDAFLGTDLEATLIREGAKQVVVTGVLTHMCCETTARSAFCRGFEVYVPVDAVASSTEERHLGSLLAMADSVAVMHSTQEVLERCAVNE